MVSPERNAMPIRGARFWREGDELKFEFVIDPGNIIGPRPALKADSEKYPEAWQAFAAGEAAEAEMPDAREPAEPAAPETIVAPKAMDGFEARLEPAPERVKPPYKRRAA